MSQASQEKPEGNTKTSGPKYQLYCWAVTIYCDEITPSQLSQHFKGFCKKYTFQQEKCPKTEKIHYQCAISLKTKEYFATVKNLVGFGAHIEGMRDSFAGFNYCKKEESRIAGPWNEKSIFLNIIKKLRPWQADLEKKLLIEPDDRSITWIYDKKGGCGKTQFCKYMAITHGATIIGSCAAKDMFYALPENPKIVMINLPRTIEERVNYGAIESIKDGMCFSSKYESGMKVFNSPHVVIMSNFEPDKETMSDDRWNIIAI